MGEEFPLSPQKNYAEGPTHHAPCAGLGMIKDQKTTKKGDIRHTPKIFHV